MNNLVKWNLNITFAFTAAAESAFEKYLAMSV